MRFDSSDICGDMAAVDFRHVSLSRAPAQRRLPQHASSGPSDLRERRRIGTAEGHLKCRGACECGKLIVATVEEHQWRWHSRRIDVWPANRSRRSHARRGSGFHRRLREVSNLARVRELAKLTGPSRTDSPRPRGDARCSISSETRTLSWPCTSRGRTALRPARSSTSTRLGLCSSRRTSHDTGLNSSARTTPAEPRMQPE